MDDFWRELDGELLAEADLREVCVDDLTVEQHPPVRQPVARIVDDRHECQQ